MRKLLPAIFFAFLSLVIVFSWFRSGTLILTGEEGLSLYDPLRTARNYTSLLVDNGSGYVDPLYPARSTFFFLAFLLNLLLPSFLTQAVIFWLYLFIGLTAFYYLLPRLISPSPVVVRFSAALFYLFNLYVYSQVWQRFLYSSMSSWALLPLFILVFIDWFEFAHRKALLWLIIISFVFSNAFGIASYVLTLWTPVGIYFLIALLRQRNCIRLSFRFITFCLVWLMASVWWLYPLLSPASGTDTARSRFAENFGSLTSVSQYFPTSQLLLLRQSFLFQSGVYLTDFINSPLAQITSILILLTVLIGVVRGRSMGKNYNYFLILGFIGWFISKGTNPPFGSRFFSFLFYTFPFTQALRNSYEKYGLVWVFVYAVFFGWGIGFLWKKFRLVALLTLVLALGFLSWPFWSGRLFSPNTHVRVPDYYRQANNFINSHFGDVRIWNLPTWHGMEAAFKWGYSGGEHSEFFFDKPVISRDSLEPFNSKYQTLRTAFWSGADYDQLLNELNIGLLVLRSDYLPVYETLGGSPSSISSRLRQNPNIKLVNQLGELAIYDYTGNPHPGMVELLGNPPPAYTSTRLSRTHFRVLINQAQTPFTLVLKYSLNPAWKVVVDGQVLPGPTLIYNFANAWTVNHTGTYYLDINFKIWPWD